MSASDVPPSNPSILLREVVDSDLPIFFEHQRDPDSVRMAAFPSRDREAFMAHWAKIFREPENLIRAVECDGQVVGNIGSFPKDGMRLVGYWIGRDHWGKGIATRALATFLTIDRFRPLHAYVAKHNVGSIRVLERCGFMACGEAKSPGETPDVEINELLYRLG